MKREILKGAQSGEKAQRYHPSSNDRRDLDLKPPLNSNGKAGTSDSEADRKQSVRKNLRMSQRLYGDILGIADEWDISDVDAVRMLIRLGLKIVTLEREPDTAVIVRRGEKEERLTFLI